MNPKQNHVSPLFRELFETFHQDAADPRVEELCADIAARVGAEHHSVCAGIVRPEQVPHYYGLACLLTHYGIASHQQGRPAGDGSFVFLGVAQDEPSEFEGATLRERPQLFEVTA